MRQATQIDKKNASEEMFQEMFHDTVTQIIKLNIIELKLLIELAK